ncbi:heterokaryon incompatibility protein-domain-containing protein [Tricladium varicosporioides]|nr:heterokaryon incompatibility protein-domain-containing protein [Hymenoscyphus varicosporioides]
MSLCGSCRSITLQKLIGSTLEDSPNSGVGLRSVKERRIVHFQRGSELFESAQHCPLCAMILEALTQESSIAGIHSTTKPPQSLDHYPIELAPMLDPLGNAFPHSAASGVHLRGFAVVGKDSTKGSCNQITGALRLYTKDETTSKLKDFILGRQRLQDSSSEAAFDLVRMWLKTCRDGHAECRGTFSGTIVDESTLPELPTRIVDVGSVEGRQPVRLFESNGAKARYIALSHCWGPRERPPLTTNRANIQEHYHSIPWLSIPKTFQDAITAVRQVGLQYIWIDSLCIVQDDQDEWLRESVKMGSIYEKAELTIAASHSSDSWQGLFLPRSESTPAVELPNFFQGEQTSIGVFATVRRDQVNDTFPEHGPLSKRGWATQEWLLSRRIVFYTNGQIIWSCKTITQRETGEKFYSIARDSKWKSIIEQYSDRQLTHLTDRLIALEGLRTELQKKTSDTYLYGLWKNSLPDQLLWQVARKVDEACNPLQLPSWTWGSTPSSVRFVRIDTAKNLCKSIKWKQSRELFVCAKLKQIESLRQGTILESYPPAAARDIEKSNAKQTYSLHRALYDVDGGHLGWVVFDLWAEELCSEPLFCLALMGTFSRRDEEIEERTGVTNSRKLREYWILVLKRCDDMEFAYERVGIGKTYGKQWWQDTTSQDVKLI